MNTIASKVLTKQSLQSISLIRTFSCSSNLCGRKSRIPFDKRFPISPKDVGPHHKYGRKELAGRFGRGYNRPPVPGYFNKFNRFIKVPEIEAELVVPDLSGFQLKPYVSYRVKEIMQSEFTPKDLFNATYSGPVIEDFKKGKLKEKNLYIDKDNVMK